MKHYAALLTLSIIWGMSFLFIKLLLPYTGPWGIVFLRCFFGVLPLYLILLLKKRTEITKKLPWKSLLIVGILNVSIPWALIGLSEMKISSSTAAILNAMTPIMTSFIGFLFFSILLSKKQWIGIFIGFVGVLILLDFKIVQLFGDDFIGIGTMIIATISYGIASQHAKKHLNQVSVLVVAIATLTIGTISGFIGMMITSSYPSGIFSSFTPIIAIIGLGIFGSGISNLLFFYMVKEKSAEFATSVYYLIPLTAMLWGYWILNETLSANLFFGLLFILVGVYLSGKAKSKIQVE
ncbi:Threonine/homoserine efflux transporter RhtA [Gracilibacillus orientalis]|uniref:Threonine/homoserine efflux transporter RhtA n=1 Tax=Gracilibacillus orientalis TaxID=334253 RepID=A0A1I4GV65_9BACI|nr:DMT family transporter [Gracilibacillus orientalis]SFL33924.1 Threonine/homoserine efflux transporter RhtA [Gracilibacillus orientalis]